ncbi:carotenoid oxygenase family protein [Streptomyces sp. WP-1]|nr:carotenoid oxygenase family protein [Streptomyces sp. WP-1]WKE73646.1 carotenoid oxygenase family protein [Streptomyces sp. WP-1]
MIHDMARTSRCLVLEPAFFDLAAALNGGSELAWRPEQPTRIALIPRDGCPVRWVDDEAFWLWHTVNAYDTPDGRVVLGYMRWPSLSLGAGPTGRAPHGTEHGLPRAVAVFTAGTVRRTRLNDARVELPRIDDRSIARPHHGLVVSAGTGRTEVPLGLRGTWLPAGG